jgi:hypothetical protein
MAFPGLMIISALGAYDGARRRASGGHLYEIESVNDEVLESRQGFPASERAYWKTLESVVDIA